MSDNYLVMIYLKCVQVYFIYNILEELESMKVEVKNLESARSMLQQLVNDKDASITSLKEGLACMENDKEIIENEATKLRNERNARAEHKFGFE